MSYLSATSDTEEVTIRKSNKLKTKIACYKALEKVYFLPSIKSKAISVNSLRNILLKSENFCCPYKSRINYMRITHSSNYMIKHIHIIANLLAYIETGTILFFSDLANKEYYEVLISMWNPEIAQRIYHYEFKKDETEIITQPLTGYKLKPKFDEFSVLRNKFVKKPNPEGNTLRNKKASLDSRLLGTEIEFRIVDGTRTEFTLTDQHLHYRLRVLSNEFQELEDSYADLKHEFQRKKKIYSLQRSLIQLRVPSIVWKAIESTIPNLDATVVDNLIKTDLLISFDEHTYKSRAALVGIPNAIESMSDFWSTLKTDIELQKYINRNMETYMKNEDIRRTKQKRYFDFINKAKLETPISCENNIAWLLIHSDDENIEVKTYPQDAMSDEYYMLFKRMPSYFTNKEFSFQLLANYVANHAEEAKTSKLRSNLVDAVITVLAQSISIDIDENIDKICDQFYNMMTIPDCKSVILQHLINYTIEYPSTLSNSSSYEIMYLSLVRKIIFRLENTGLRIDKILPLLFKLAGETANHTSVTLLYTELDQLFEFKQSAAYITLIEQMNNVGIPTPARIEVLIGLMRHSEELDEAIRSKYSEMKLYCANALEWMTAIKPHIGQFNAELASIITPLKSALQEIIRTKHEKEVDNTLRALYCMAQLPHVTLSAAFNYKAMLELVRCYTDLSLTFEWVTRVTAAIKIPMTKNELSDLLLICIPATNLNRDLTLTDFDELNVIGIASALKKPVKMNGDWANVMKDLFSLYLPEHVSGYVNNIIEADIGSTPLSQLTFTDAKGIP